MPKRRSLSAGIKVTKEQEEDFIYDRKQKRPAKAEPKEVPPKKPKARARPTLQDEPSQPEEEQLAIPAPIEAPASIPAGRAPLSTRIRADIAAALKEASLKRQLTRETPNTVQEILEEALEPWLKERGFFPK